MNQKKKQELEQELENEIAYFREHLKPEIETELDLPPRLRGENMRRLLDQDTEVQDSMKSTLPHKLYPWRQIAVAACGVVVIGLSVYFWQSGSFGMNSNDMMQASPQAMSVAEDAPVEEEAPLEEEAAVDELEPMPEASAAEPIEALPEAAEPMLQSAPILEEAAVEDESGSYAKSNRAAPFALQVGAASEILKDSPFETSWGTILWEKDLVEIQSRESASEYSVAVSDETNHVIASDEALVLLECDDSRTNVIYYQLGASGEPRQVAEYGQNGVYYNYQVNEGEIYIMSTLEGGTDGDKIYWDESGKEQPILPENQTAFQDVKSSYYMFISHADGNGIEVKSAVGHMLSAWYDMEEEAMLVDNYSDSGEIESIRISFTK